MGFFDDFLGKSSRRDLESGKAAADADLRAGYGESLGFSNKGLTDSNAITQPFLDRGRKAFDLYSDSYGVGGEGARNAAYGLFKSDPFNQHSDQLTQNSLYNLMKRYNAGGMSNSGTSNLALSRAGLEANDRRIADWRGGLQGLGNTGVGLASDQANRTYGTGQFNAGLRSGLGQQLASNNISYSNAMAQSRNTGWQNIMGLGGTLSRFIPGGGGGSSAPAYKPSWPSYYS